MDSVSQVSEADAEEVLATVQRLAKPLVGETARTQWM